MRGIFGRPANNEGGVEERGGRMAGHKEERKVPGQMRRLRIYIQKRKCDKRRRRRSGAFEGGPGFFFVWAEREPRREGCADQQEKAARVSESVGRQADRAQPDANPY